MNKHKGFIGVFEFRPFRFEGPAQRRTFKKRCKKTLKKRMVFHRTTITKSFKNRGRTQINKSSKNNAKMEPQMVPKPSTIDQKT